MARACPKLLVTRRADTFLSASFGRICWLQPATSSIPLTLRMQPGYDHSYFFISPSWPIICVARRAAAVSPLLDVMIAAARAAGREVERIYGAGCATEWKADGSPVTEADRAAEAIILAHLGEAYPELPVVAEEEACAGRIPQLGARWFLVDPLDGTRGFIDRNGEFTVNIALIDAGRPVAGVVHAPDHRILYAGERGAGAWRSRDGAPPEPIATRAPPPEGLTAIASRSDAEGTRARIGSSADRRIPAVQLIAEILPDRGGQGRSLPPFWPHDGVGYWCGPGVLEAAGGRVLGWTRTAGRPVRWPMESPGSTTRISWPWRADQSRSTAPTIQRLRVSLDCFAFGSQ
jgi:3'(2'), 5'-bisphosphate nucleotidase